MPDVSVYLVDLPVREMVVPSGPCSWTVYIDARLSYEGQREAYDHALRHIQRGDWERDDVQAIEAEAHIERG